MTKSIWVIRYLDRLDGKTDARVYIYDEFHDALNAFKAIVDKWISLEHPSLVDRLIEDKVRSLHEIGIIATREDALKIIKENIIGYRLFANVSLDDSLVFSMEECNKFPMEIRMDYSRQE